MVPAGLIGAFLMLLGDSPPHDSFDLVFGFAGFALVCIALLSRR